MSYGLKKLAEFLLILGNQKLAIFGAKTKKVTDEIIKKINTFKLSPV